MWIKICANTSLDDALLAAQSGADAVGFVFAPSSRHVTPAEVARITPHLPQTIERVGVFPSLPAEEISHIARVTRLDAVQLHSGMNLDFLRELRPILHRRIKMIQTVHWDVGDGANSAESVARQLRALADSCLADRVLIDSRLGQTAGGTGVAFDWTSARAVLAEAGKELDLIVAGGLRPENVALAVAELKPWGVDVASGVEASPGRKSPEKLSVFLRNARG